MRIKLLLIPLLFAILCSCTPKITVVDQEGRPAMNYVIDMRTPDGNSMSCRFYILKEKEAGKYAVDREYLNVMDEYKFRADDKEKVTLFLHILNPKSLEYSLYYTHEYDSKEKFNTIDDRTQVKTKGGMQMSYGMFKRIFPNEIPIPLDQVNKEGQIIPKRVDDVVYKGNDPDKEFTVVAPKGLGDHQILLTIFRDGRIQAIFGDFHYSVE